MAVIFAGLQTHDELDSPAWRERTRRRGGSPDDEHGTCRAGTPGAAFVGPQPQAGEAVIAKLRYSAFFGTPLDALPAEQWPRHLETSAA